MTGKDLKDYIDKWVLDDMEIMVRDDNGTRVPQYLLDTQPTVKTDNSAVLYFSSSNI